jgi:hypothetical protein
VADYLFYIARTLALKSLLQNQNLTKMKSVVRLSLLLLLSAGLITSCKKSVPKQTKFIPKGATFVASVNAGSIQSKLVKSQATLENLLKNMAGESDTAIDKGKKEWEDLKNSGIDLGENFYMWVVQKGGGNLGSMGGGNSVVSAIGALKDAGKFEAYLKKKDGTLEVKKEKDYSYVTKDGDKMIAWGQDVVMVMSYQKAYAGGMMYDSITGSYNMQSPADANMVNDLKTEMTASFNQKESESVGAIAEFADLAQDKADASMWINSGASLENIPLPLPKLKELIQDSYTAATFNFDEGKIVMNSKSYSGKAMKDILGKYKGTDADLSLVERYPSSNLNGFMVFSFDPQVINAIVRYMEVGGVVDGYLTKFMGTNYTLQDALKAIKGDLAFVVSDFAMVAGDTTMAPGIPAYSMPKAKLIFTMPVGDKVQMNKLMDRLVQMDMVVKANGEYKPKGNLPAAGFTAVVDDKNFIIASDNDLLTSYRSNTGKAKLKDGVMNDFKDKSGVFYFDVESMLSAASGKTNMAAADEVMPVAKETFRDVRGYATNFNGKFTEAHFEMRFKNEKENSLTSLINFAAKAGEIAMKNKQVTISGMDDMMPPADTSAIAP